MHYKVGPSKCFYLKVTGKVKTMKCNSVLLKNQLIVSYSYGTVSRNTNHCNFQLLTEISFQIYNFISKLQTKIMILGCTTNNTCRFGFKQYKLFYTVQNMKFGHSWKLCHMIDLTVPSFRIHYEI